MGYLTPKHIDSISYALATQKMPLGDVGRDLYVYQLGERNWKWKAREFLRRPVIKNMGCITPSNKGDIKNAVEWYGFKRNNLSCVFYTSSTICEDINNIACEISN